jgi:hypothetical protein
LRALPADAAANAWPASYRELAVWLSSAERTARQRTDAAAALLAAGFQKRLHAEYDTAAQRVVQARAAPGFLTESGELRAGSMQHVEGVGWRYPGPRAVADERTLLLDAHASVRPHEAIVIGVEASRRADREELAAAYVAARISGVEAWAGRRSMSVGSAARAGIVLNAARLDGVGISLRNGLRAGFLGTVRLDAALARGQRSGDVLHPYFHAARLSFTPTPALGIGLNRALLFGGEGNESITPRRIALALLGFSDTQAKDSDFENQVASIDVLWRAGGSSAVLLYGEFGVDDTGFAFLHVPGIIAGAQLGRFPALPELQLGVEVVHFQESCCSYPPWYQHGALGDGWTDRGRLLGHPLGGDGSEGVLLVRVDMPRQAANFEGRLFARERGAENLFAPTHQGRSYGLTADAVMAFERTVFSLRAGGEWGDGWRAGQVHARIAVRL